MKKCIFSIIVFMLITSCIYGQVDIYGYFEPQYTGFYYDSDFRQFQSNKLRTDIKSTVTNNVEFGANMIFVLYFGKKDWNILDFLPENITSSIPPDLYPFYQFVFQDTFYLDNVYARISNYRYALTIGKQQISLGTGYFTNPLDVLNAKDALDPTYEQPGHNAIRGDVSLANRLSIMAMYTPIELDWSNSGKLARIKVGFGHFDFSVLGYEFQQISTDFFTFTQSKQKRRLIGGDLVGELLGFGIWAEGCYNFSEQDNDDFYEFVVGTDYTFESGFYTMFEYHHNSSGKSDYTEYNLNDWMRFFAGEVKTISQDQIYGLMQYPVTDLIMVGSSAIFNISDQSAAFVPMVYYSIFENCDLTLMFNLYVGEEGKAYSSNLGNGGFLRCQVYF